MSSKSTEEKVYNLVENKKKRKNKYIPGLAAMRFQPDDDWSKIDAFKLYTNQIKRLGNYETDKIYYQDCIEGMHKLPPESIDLIIADPPFGLGFTGKESIYNRDSDFVIDDYGEVQGDYFNFTKKWIAELPRIMKKTSSAYIFSGWTNLEDVLRSIREVGLSILNHIIWQYQFGVFTRKKFVTSHYHLLLVVKDTKKYYFNKILHYPGDIWNIKRDYDQKKKKNGTKLPIQLIQKCIDFSSKPGSIILDPFMGNGTTAETAKANFRHFIGFEINTKLRPIIEANLKTTEIGEDYRMYKSLKPPIEELKKKYPQAFEIYRKEMGINNTSR
ncbi:MAG: DNA-methyltransferase [Candidatus Hodarchaeales archaeon]